MVSEMTRWFTCGLHQVAIPEDAGRKGWAEGGNERKEKKVQRISKEVIPKRK
jgi:hypothetical protein